ncbi:unnamed protein product [Parnassius apollo]|uniref:(apollo) hypothetical protein n=1 Tax=Parnassius apollo TaxID=110799 RepID=A0A8S3XPL0_PARAO|nr:unnamed protein product [Parnassius apollo]
MGCYQVALFVALALILQRHQLLADNCNNRKTFIQIRVPQRTVFSFRYPKEINTVQLVPFPNNPSRSECIKCQGTTCNKCTYTKSAKHSSTTNVRKTNIIIDIRGTRKINDTTSETTSKNYNNTSETVDGTIVGIYDKTWAASKSGATANTGEKGNSSAAIAAGSTLSQSDILAALNEEEINKSNGEQSHVEDIFVISEDGSAANASSSSIATKGDSANDGKEASGTQPSNGMKPGEPKQDSSDNVPAVSPSPPDVPNYPSSGGNPALKQPSAGKNINKNPKDESSKDKPNGLSDSKKPESDSAKNKPDSTADDKNTPAQNGAATAAHPENPASPDTISPISDSVKNNPDSIADDKNTPAQNGAATVAHPENPASPDTINSIADDKNTPAQNEAAAVAHPENPASPDTISPVSDSVKNKPDSIADDKNTPAQNGAATAAHPENPA